MARVFLVKGFGKGYSTGEEFLDVEINGFKTQISHFLKSGQRMKFIYTIRSKSGKFVEFDTRNIDGLEDATSIESVKSHIMANQSQYEGIIS